MKIFIFIHFDEINDKFDLGLLSEDQNISEMQTILGIPPNAVRSIINQVPCDCIFVGKNLRKMTLTPLLHKLCKMELDLPEKLKFHWVPPFKLPFEDIDWLFNFGIFPEIPETMVGILRNLNLQSTNTVVIDLARIYFTLIGDFNKLK